MSESILITKTMPYCPGCGHTVITNQLNQALSRLSISPLDVVVVSDIGCCGLVDALLACHTVHGLHGRSTALGMGITLGLNNPKKKVIVIQGDGGATIGLQHLLEAARQNVDLTLIVHNNMVYGMTGGQISGLSPEELMSVKLPEEEPVPPFDIVTLAHKAGAVYSSRVFVGGKLNEILMEALETPGFSLIEVVEMCPSHGIKKIKELKEIYPYPEIKFTGHRPSRKLTTRSHPSLFDKMARWSPAYRHYIQQRLEIVIAGSAGEGIQSAGDILASAGILAGLHTTKKGEYPITVGTGFSVVEVILSRDEIHYTGIDTPDVAIIVSEDGWKKVQDRIQNTPNLIVDSQINVPYDMPLLRGNFRELAGGKGAALCAMAFWLKKSKALPLEALHQVIQGHRHAESLLAALEPLEKLVVQAF